MLMMTRNSELEAAVFSSHAHKVFMMQISSLERSGVGLFSSPYFF